MDLLPVSLSIPPVDVLSEEDEGKLVDKFTTNEIKNAVFSM